MANTNLSVRFTDESYATRSEIAKALGTNLIDNIWGKVLEYRHENAKQLAINDVTKKPFFITLTNVLREKYQRFDSRLIEVNSRFNEFEQGFDKDNLRKTMLKLELKIVAKAKGIIVNDIAIDNIVNFSQNNPLYVTLVNYYNAILLFEANSQREIDDQLIAEYLDILGGGMGLSSYYREKEIAVPGQKALINREYVGAPVYRIEDMMQELFSYLQTSDDNLTVKLAVLNFVFNYVKPFERFNEEIAVFISKHLISRVTVSDVSLYLPLELVMVEDAQGFAIASRESQKFNDLTYYVNQIVKVYEDSIRHFMDRSFILKRDQAENAYYGQPDIKEQQAFEQVQKEQYVQPKPVQQVPIQKPVETVVRPQVVKPVEKPVTQTYIPSTNEPKVDVSKYQELDEKALIKAAEELMHKDPTLRKAQAHFYVRHCTPGYSYTIQDFKKSERCVYETARTSMDDLARGGYYRREQYKNKFIYIVISK